MKCLTHIIAAWLPILLCVVVAGCLPDHSPLDGRLCVEDDECPSKVCESGYCRLGPAPAPTVQPPDGFALIEADAFLMGSSSTSPDHQPTELQHQVRITRSFAMQKGEVTQSDWRTLMEVEPPGAGDCDNCPLASVTWYEALAFANALSLSEDLPTCYLLQGCDPQESLGQGFRCEVAVFTGLDCAGYRLPTEAEWEYAARGGTTEDTYGPLEDIAWTAANSAGQANPGQEKAPNDFGLFDTIGNVSEWVQDPPGAYDEDPSYDPEETLDPLGQQQPGPRRAIARGGDFTSPAPACRAPARGDELRADESAPTIGFRLVRTFP